MLEGQVALVTGGSRGIGRAIALRLAAAGAHVVVNYYLNREAGEKTLAEVQTHGVKGALLQADMKDPGQIRTLLAAVGEQFGRLDILVSNAASGVFRPAHALTAKHWDWMMNTHPRAFLLCAQAALPLMRSGGRMVAVSSIGSQRTIPQYAGMGASKAALESLTRYLAVEYGPLGIAVNGVSGGAVSTESWQQLAESNSVLEGIARRTPAGRIARPEDIADVVLFLCSSAAEMIRGQVIIVDGGYSITT
ncbi:MAG TPA: SDR family oxidoreductase [Candidatus Baltobacteraceae bacterium]|nr:SDR family oxidoreductase [Candidatus Baltobacteraceae bacterium]